MTQSLEFQAARDDARTEPGWIRWIIITLAIAFLVVFVVLPLVLVFSQAFSRGIGAYWKALERFAEDVCVKKDVVCTSYSGYLAATGRSKPKANTAGG